jgi:hypothetical protein
MIPCHASAQFNPPQRTAAPSPLRKQATWPRRSKVAAAGDGRAPGPCARAGQRGTWDWKVPCTRRRESRRHDSRLETPMNRAKSRLIGVNPATCFAAPGPSNAALRGVPPFLRRVRLCGYHPRRLPARLETCRPTLFIDATEVARPHPCRQSLAHGVYPSTPARNRWSVVLWSHGPLPEMLQVVAPCVAEMLHLKLLTINVVAGVAGFLSIAHISHPYSQGDHRPQTTDPLTDNSNKSPQIQPNRGKWRTGQLAAQAAVKVFQTASTHFSRYRGLDLDSGVSSGPSGAFSQLVAP